MSKSAGRPMKYKHLLLALSDKNLYTPACIALNAEALGLIKVPKHKPEKLNMRRKIRHTMARYKANHGFPENGDGIIKIFGQAPTPAWLGSRWKARLLEAAN